MGSKRPRTAWRIQAAGLFAVVGTLLAAPAGAQAARPEADCQPFAKRPCLLPFPNNLFTKRDKHTKTHLRVKLPQRAMPQNTSGQRIAVGPYDRADGFDPGSTIIVKVPGLDNQQAFNNTRPVQLQNIARYKQKHAPIALIDARTGKRWPIWAELDSTAPDPRSTTLLIHPAKLLSERHRYIVVLRHLKNAKDKTLKAPRWFRVLRDGKKKLPRSERSQTKRYASIFKTLRKKAKIGRRSLYAAWDFTVESRESLTTPMLTARNDAFGQLGDSNLGDGQVSGGAPSFNVLNTSANPPDEPGIQEEITGTFLVPCYLKTPNCAQGGSFNYKKKKPYPRPAQIPGNFATAPFDCVIPSSASPTNPARASFYGHGLFGSDAEAHSSSTVALATEHNFMFCATEWWGLAGDSSGAPGGENDIGYDAGVLQNLSLFPTVADRLQQAVLNTLYLGRLMRSPQGFASNAAFQQGGQPLFDPNHLYYYGNSLGGIMGGMTVALEPDLTRGVLGVPGLDFGGLLLQRSTDFVGTFDVVEKAAYPDTSEYTLTLDLIEQLWGRAEPDGYAQHMTTKPLPGTPSHKVLMQVAYGDHQVSQYAAMVEARTIGAFAHEPALDADRSQDRNLFFGVPRIRSYPFGGSGVVIWDDGPGLVSPPPLANQPPTAGHDPHSDVRATVAARNQISAFLNDNGGAIIDVCGGAPCRTDVFTP